MAKNFNPRSPHRERQKEVDFDNPRILISIHAPLTGSDELFNQKLFILRKFQSTLPSQGATDLYPMTPFVKYISIHAPLTGSDKCSHFLRRRTGTFQSTLPSQGATANIHIKFLCDLLFSTLSSKNSFTLSRFPQTIT